MSKTLNCLVIFQPYGPDGRFQTIKTMRVVDAWDICDSADSKPSLRDARDAFQRRRIEGAYKSLGDGELSLIIRNLADTRRNI